MAHPILDRSEIPPHAGFDAVALVDQYVLGDALRLLYRARVFPSRFQGRQPFNEGTQINFDFGAGSPRLNIEGLPLEQAVLADEQSNAAVLEIQARGQVSLTPTPAWQGAPFETKFDVALTFVIDVPLTVLSTTDASRIALALDRATIREATVDSTNERGQQDTVFATPILETAKQQLLEELGAQGELAVSTGLLRGFLGDDGAEVRVHARVFQHGVLLAADGLRPADPATGEPPRGRLEDIWDFSGSHRLAVTLHPAFPESLFESMLDTAKAEAAKAGGDDFYIDRLSVSLAEDHVYVDGHAALEDPGVDPGASFEFRVRPIVTDGRIALDFYDVDIDIDDWLEALVVLGAFLLFGPWAGAAVAAGVTVAIGSFVNSFEKILERTAEDEARAALAEGSAKVGRQLGTPGVYDVPIPGVDGGYLRVVMHDLAFGTHGVTAWAHTKAPATKVRLSTPDDIDQALVGMPFSLHFRLRHDTLDFNPDDPMLRVRWEIRGDDDEQPRLLTRRPYADASALDMSYDFEPGPARVWKVSAAIERELTPAEAAVWKQERVVLAERTLDVPVIDRVPQRHRFIQWRYTTGVMIPRRRASADGEPVSYLRYRRLKRRSKIHLSAYPGRCREVSYYTARTSRRFSFPEPRGPAEDVLDAHFEDLCPYCFFGGPDKSVLRPEIAKLLGIAGTWRLPKRS